MKSIPIATMLACALALSGCIQSSGPILSESAPVFGPNLHLQLYGLHKGLAHDPEQVSFAWNGHVYARSGGGLRDVEAFTAHPFESGDLLIQTVPAKRAGPTEFAVAHKLIEGVWQVWVIDEADADEATRATFCKNSSKAGCEIDSRDQLLAFARATAAQRKDDGGLAIRLADAPERRARRRR
jgi:hypothetical protein